MTGRPSSYTQETADIICERLMDGESMVDICRDEAMPSRSSVLRWMEANPEFEARCARAREMQADLMDDMILRVANACTPETAQADKVKISAYQWRASKLQPKKYGDKVTNEHTGKDGGPIEFEHVTKEQRDAAVAAASRADR